MEKRQFDVTALGELLIDFTENGFSSQGNPLMEANPGGAPCNVCLLYTSLRGLSLLPQATDPCPPVVP